MLLFARGVYHERAPTGRSRSVERRDERGSKFIHVGTLLFYQRNFAEVSSDTICAPWTAGIQSDPDAESLARSSLARFTADIALGQPT